MTIKETCALLRAQNQYLLLTHRRPDGDTIGSAVALCALLRAMGKTAYLHPNEDLTARLAPMAEPLHAPEGFAPQCVVAIDIADTQLLPASAQGLAGNIALCVDHHPSNKQYARATCLMEHAAATGEIIWLLCEELGLGADKLPPLFHEACYVAVATDTGCFRFSNTTPLAHTIAAACIARGIDFYSLNRTFFEQKTRARFQLEQHLFGALVFDAGSAVASVAIDRAFLDKLHATDDDLDNLSSLTMQLEDTLCGIVLVQNKDGETYKASVRTRAPLDASALCKHFGGGGHARAAGCTLRGAGEECRKQLAALAEEAVAAC